MSESSKSFNGMSGNSAAVLQPLNPDDTRTPYVQIADRIRQAVAEGKWRQGGRLPGTGPIARRYGVSTETAHRAVKLLEAEGIVRSIRPYGTFVRGLGAWEVTR